MLQDPKTRKELESVADLLLTGPVEFSAKQTVEVDDDTVHMVDKELSELEDTPQNKDSATRTRCELIFTALLPGFATPWLSQYAHQLAGLSGTVGVVRISADRIELESFEGRSPLVKLDDPDTEEAVRSARNRGRIINDRQMLTEALRSIFQQSRRVLIVPLHARIDEFRTQASRFANWTILTGGDDNAVVTCYQLLKQLLGDTRLLGPSEGVNLVFAGCDEATAHESCIRIRKAANKYLEVPVDFGGLLQRMQPVARHRLGSYAPDRNPWDLIQAALEESDQRQQRSGSLERPLITDDELDELHSDQPSDALLVTLAELERAETNLRDGEPSEPPKSQAPAEPPPAPIPFAAEPKEKPAEKPAAQQAATPDAPASEPAPAAPHGDAPPSLSGYIPRLRKLAAKCPRHEQAELASDPTGRLHVLYNGVGESADAALRALLEARAWAQEHAQLIGMTDAPAHIQPDAEPIAHLFTNAPRSCNSYARTVSPLNPTFHLHLLKKVQAAGDTIWVHEELS